MMRLLVLGMLLLFNLNASAAVEQIAKHDNSNRISTLASQICGLFSTAGDKIAEKSKKVIIQYMKKHEGKSNPTGAQILQFLNKNKHKMTCKRNGIEVNYMKVAFDRGAETSLFDKLFFNDLMPDDQSVLPDVNAVSYTGPGGTPETVLDYMDRIIATNKYGSENTKELKDLRAVFVEELGAKKFKALSSTEQAKFK